MFDVELLSIIASVVLVFILGYSAKKLGILKQEQAPILNNVIIYLTLPALIFKGIYTADLEGKLYLVAVISLLTTGFVMAIAFLISRFLKLEPQLAGTFMLVAAIGNTGYIAYPLLISLYGNTGLVRGIFYDMFGTVIVILTIGLYICSVFGKSAEKPSIIRQLFSFPPIYGLFLGFILKPFVLPEVLMRTVDIVAAVTVGLILISVGLSLEPVKEARRYIPLLSLTFVLKLLISPFIVFLLAKIFPLDGLSVRASVLSASMPPALLTLVFGLKYGLDAGFLSSSIFILTIASAVTVPLMQLLLR